MEINGHDEITGDEIDKTYDEMRDAGFELTWEQNQERLSNG